MIAFIAGCITISILYVIAMCIASVVISEMEAADRSELP